MADLSKIKIPNGTEYNLKDAQARADITALNGSLGELDDVINGSSMFNYLKGKNIDASGALVDESGCYTSEFVPLTWTGIASYFCGDNTKTSYYVAFYDANKSFIQRFQNPAVINGAEYRQINHETQVTQGTEAYVRFSFKSGTTGKIMNANRTENYWIAQSVSFGGIVSDIGDLSELATEEKDSLVGAINEAIGSLGDYASLSTNKRTTIPDNTDLNDLTTPGQYKVGSVSKAKTITNIPKQAAGILDVSTGTSTTVVIQIYTVVPVTLAPYSYTRSKTSSGWTDWVLAINSTDFEKAMKITGADYATIAANTDLNTITTPGAYKVTTAAIAGSLTNSPLSTIGFTLRVINIIDAATICQLAIGASSTLSIYIRYGKYTTSEWGDWKKIALDFDEDTLISALNTMGTAVSSNTQRIEDIEDSLGVSTEYFTPYTAQEQDLYDKVNNDIDKNTLVFLVSTDNHYRETADSGSHQVEFAQVMAKIAKRLRVDAIINLGDIITQYMDSVDDAVYENEDVTAEEINTRRLAKMATAFQSTSVPFLYALAHHEMCLHTNSPTSTDNTTQTSVYPYPESKVLGLCGKGAEWLEEHHYSQDPLSAGYYVDFSRHKIRLIFIDSASYTATGFTPSSIAFITEAFSNVPTGYKVIVCTHVATREPGVYSATIKNWQQVETIMGNFVSNGGTILAVLHGHAHYDNVVFIENVPYPYICICCAENSWSTVGEKIEAGVQGNPVSYKYHAARYGALGTYNEYLFDIMCVHPDRNTINFFRFGIGEDRTVSLSET